MKLKRAISIVISLVMLCLVFSSCNGQNFDADSNSESLNTSSYENINTSSGDTQEPTPEVKIDFTNLLFGESYNLGTDATNLDIETDVDGVLEFDGSNMNVVGIGRGNLTINTAMGDTLYDGIFVVYNSILATEIRQQLIANGVINKMGDVITAKELEHISEIKLDKMLLNDASAIQGVKYLTNLQSLSLRNNNLSDINFLSNLKNLVEVDLSNNNLTDISSLRSSRNLLSLNISDNNISDISSLVYFGSLQAVNVSNNNISDIKALSTLFDLKEVYLNNNNINSDNIDAISGLDQIVKLGVGYCSVEPSTIYALKYIKNLEYLDMSGLTVDLALLPKSNVMKQLVLREASLSGVALTPLSEFKNLEYIDISKNKLDLVAITEYINSLEVDNKINYLSIGENRIVSLPDLSKLNNLKTLDLKNSYNLIDIYNLTTNTNIEEIYLDLCNSISFESGEKSFISIMNQLESLKKVSLINGMYYVNRENYNYLTERINEKADFSFKLFEDEWVSKNTLENYAKTVYFSMQEFLSDCKQENNGYKYDVLSQSRKIILNLIDENNTQGYTLMFPQEIFEINIYARENKTFNHSFDILEREQSEFIFNLYNYNTQGNNGEIINAKYGSKLIINNFGKSSLSLSNKVINKVAVNCYDLSINSANESCSLIIAGGKGYNGSNGPTNHTSWSSRHGGNGGAGYAGVNCHNATIKGYGISIVGGNGGNGGNGGKADGAAAWDWGANGQNGGNGGHGGSGGNGINYSGQIYYDETVTIKGGNGGNGGNGGEGGGWGHETYRGAKGNRGGNGSATYKVS